MTAIILLAIITALIIFTIFGVHVSNEGIYAGTICIIGCFFVLSMAISNKYRQSKIEKTIAKHNIIEYKIDAEKNVNVVLKDTTKFNKELYKQCIK